MTSVMKSGFRVGPADDPDRYSLGPAVASGAEGILYRGSITTVTGLEFPVAIKMLQPRFLQRVNELHARWSEQVELLRSLQVPGVVRVRDGFLGPLPHGPGEAGGDTTLYLVMNWVEGEPLDEWVQRRPDRDPFKALKLLLGVAAALDLMHSGGPTGGIPVVHRDVKPSNILVTEEGTVLVDFGLTRGLPEGQRLSGVTGTPGYLAPEATRAGVYTPATDRYAFGGVAYFVLTGTEPPSTHQPEQLRAALRSVPALAAQPETIEHLMVMLDADPAARPDALANWVGQLRGSSLTLLPEVLAPQALRRHPESAAYPNERLPTPGQSRATWSPNKSVVNTACLVGGFLVSFLLFRYSAAMGVSLAVTLGIGALGAWLGSKSAPTSDSPLNRFICWSNILTWLVPPLGVFTSAYVIAMLWGRQAGRRGHMGLSAVCLLLALVNGALGGVAGNRASEGREAVSELGSGTTAPVTSLPRTFVPKEALPVAAASSTTVTSPSPNKAVVAEVPVFAEGFGSVAVDSAHKQLFVSSPMANAISVLDFDGNVVSTIDAVAGGSALLVEGETLYVTATAAGRIEMFDTKTRQRRGELGQGTLVDPGPLVKAGGRLWTTTGSCRTRSIRLVSINLGTKAVVVHPALNETSSCIGLVSSSKDPAALLVYDLGLSPATVSRLDVASGAPTVVVSRREEELGNLKQLALLPSGEQFVAASGSPYRIDQFRTSDLVEDGFRYITGSYPNAVAVTAARGGLLAAGRDASYDPDIDVFEIGKPSRKLLTYDFGQQRTLIDGGLAWSGDGTRLFAISGDHQKRDVRVTVLAVPEK